MTTIEFPVDEIESLGQLSEQIAKDLDISLEPIPEILQDCPVRYAVYEKEAPSKYNFECGLSFILEEDEAGEPTELLDITVYIAVNGTKEYRGTIAIPVTQDNILNFEAQFKKQRQQKLYHRQGRPRRH